MLNTELCLGGASVSAISDHIAASTNPPCDTCIGMLQGQALGASHGALPHVIVNVPSAAARVAALS